MGEDLVPEDFRMETMRSIMEIMGLPPCECQSCSRCQPVVPSKFRAMLWRVRSRCSRLRVTAAYFAYLELAGH